MGHIFYILVLMISVIVFSILSKFFKLKKIDEWYNKFQKVTGKVPEKNDFRSEEEFNLHSSFIIVNSLEIVILVGGLLTSSWYVFLTLLLLVTLVNYSTKPIKYTILGNFLSLIMILIRLFTYVFLVINHFHLHLDVYELLTT